jgi:hypothetical protein
VDRVLFDASRPRLAAFDAEHAEPTPEDLAARLDSLTPTDWVARLSALTGAALRIDGRAPTGGWRVVDEPEWKHGPTFASALRAAGVPDGEPSPGADVIVVASRVPLAPERLAEIQQHAAARPTVLIGLQNDRFLDHVPAAALRISAADCTPLTRQVVAERLAALRSGLARV